MSVNTMLESKKPSERISEMMTNTYSKPILSPSTDILIEKIIQYLDEECENNLQKCN